MRVLGCAFARLAGICAYFITLDEMHRHMRSRWRAHTEALHAVITAHDRWFLDRVATYILV
jgi:hypothetical protein